MLKDEEPAEIHELNNEDRFLYLPDDPQVKDQLLQNLGRYWKNMWYDEDRDYVSLDTKLAIRRDAVYKFCIVAELLFNDKSGTDPEELFRHISKHDWVSKDEFFTAVDVIRDLIKRLETTHE